MRNGWTGGQYSLYRALFGAYLLVHFASLLPWGRDLFSNEGAIPDAATSPLFGLFPSPLHLSDSPAAVAALLLLAIAASAFFAVGSFDRIAAVTLWYVSTSLFDRNPLLANPSLPHVGWLLLAHAFLPPAPFGSLARRGRADPGHAWRLPSSIFAAAWIVLALSYAYGGATKLASPSWLDGSALARVLENPLARPTPLREILLSLPAPFLQVATFASLGLELAFAPLALFRRLRPWVWAAALAMHLNLLLVLDFADLTLGMVFAHLFTLDPGWVGPKAAPAPERVFFDGGCGLCHRFVRFALAEDAGGTRFRFSPLDGDAFRATIPPERRAGLPDSVVLLAADGAIRTKSEAILRVAERLGGIWRVLGTAARLLPRGIRDLAYDLVARSRRRLFEAPAQACPIVPAGLRDRFEL
ncbi:MAG: DCC1-like thiol-disulfide oxidoreductase family protein [Planctomycetes bacterium]|nr:DCC1-like thiol-disulfide oxidoreductase family protein [Planctomycetota bacterium]